MPLSDVELGASVQVLRFENEAEDLLHYLARAGIEPGQQGTMVTAEDPDDVAFEAGGRTVSVERTVAETVSVIADPSPPPRVALPDQLVFARDKYGR